jgi:hypothetical protein
VKLKHWFVLVGETNGAGQTTLAQSRPFLQTFGAIPTLVTRGRFLGRHPSASASATRRDGTRAIGQQAAADSTSNQTIARLFIQPHSDALADSGCRLP